MNLLLFLSLLIICSCSGHHIVTAKDCAGDGIWYDKELSDENISDEAGFEYETTSTAFLPILFWDTTYVSEVLEDNNVSCGDLEHLSIQYSTGIYSFFTRILPFFNSYTVKVTGTLKHKMIQDQEDN
ncbi:MAG: hypothetical protein H6622_09505 [Halobacteriovoraceae bacterium]|nr:hypothetical protein [Halobacteriovoraceae bacterium]